MTLHYKIYKITNSTSPCASYNTQDNVQDTSGPSQYKNHESI
uniref:Uncharacterized protein n=1 Tax=Anguilla anguilla TaxID=7936 RepID=A0A0E9W865_ANGAN